MAHMSYGRKEKLMKQRPTKQYEGSMGYPEEGESKAVNEYADYDGKYNNPYHSKTASKYKKKAKNSAPKSGKFGGY